MDPGTEVAPGRPLVTMPKRRAGRWHLEGERPALLVRSETFRKREGSGWLGGEYSRGPDPMRLMAGPRIFWRGDLCPVLWGPL
jgi:hypothetical protein